MARHAHDREPSDAPAATGDAARAVELGSGPAAGASRARSGRKQQSERSCIVTRTVRRPDELIRFVLSPQTQVVPDVRRALPGRGVWVTASRARIDEACRRKAFGRAFKREVTTPVDLADQVGSLLRKDALQALSLANKAGALTAGFEKTRAVLENDEALALIEASDGSADGRRKLIAASRRNERAAAGGSVPAASAMLEPAIIDCFTSSELDLALGRPHVIHAALLKAPAGGFALTRCLRLHRFELIEKHASGGAERCGAARESRNPNRQSVTHEVGESSRRTEV